jgi:Na+-driven multidrug efflux pump
VASSYFLLAATAIYSLASVPVALHYLDDTKRFGLWIVMGTLVGYLNLIDAGMTAAVARLLIDHKDDRNGGSYGSLIKTSWLVSTLQGAIIFVIGLSLAGVFARLLVKTEALRPEFIQLVNWQCGVVALTFATRMFNLVLNAHQRMDLANYIGAGGLAVNFAAQWIFFKFGFGLLSLALGSLVAAAVTVAGQALACTTLKLLPDARHWGRVSRRHFSEMFNYSKDVFLVSVGNQLIMTSQILVITSTLGEASAAVWGVGLRVFNLLNQVIWRLSDVSGAALAEMLVRGEVNRLRERYRSLAILSFSFAGWLAVSFALCNSLFITLWTQDKIHWPASNDWLLAGWMIIMTITQCHNKLVLLTKKIGAMRYIYFMEGVVFVMVSCLVARRGGLPAIIGSSIVCSAIFSGAYGVWRVSCFFDFSLREVALGWLRPMGTVWLFYLPAAVLAGYLADSLPPIIRLGISAALAGSVGFCFFLRYGIPAMFQKELLLRVPVKVSFPLKHIFLSH